jgi:threonine dehydratase
MNLFEKIEEASRKLHGVTSYTECNVQPLLSEEFNAQIFLKREDLQPVRSYKIRGAYNKISQLDGNNRKLGVVCASAGNHAQGVAYSCRLLNLFGTIYMPATTPKQKIKQVKFFGREQIEIVLVGDTFDDAFYAAQQYSKQNNIPFIHPFDDQDVIAGQGTIGLEIVEQVKLPIDFLILPVGGGGLAAGVSTVFRHISPQTTIIGVEPQGAPSMTVSLDKGVNTALDQIDKFVDGAAVKRVGDLNFQICRDNELEMMTVPEGMICDTILKLYDELAMVVEPAGALSISALQLLKERIQGKVVVCIVSGSNNDITRTEEIRERALFFKGLKHYFLIEFPQRPGALKEFVSAVLGENDDITYFQFSKKNNKESGPAVVGVEVSKPDDFQCLKTRLQDCKFNFEYLNSNPVLFNHLIG